MKKLFYNCVVYTGNDFKEAFIVEDNHFIFVGKKEEAFKLIDDNDEIIDLNNKFVCAGFNDSHMHLLGYGKNLKNISLFEHSSDLKIMLDYVKQEIDKYELKENEWIIGRGWNQDYFLDEKRMPNRYDLDTISNDNPIVLTRACGHALVLNSKALSLCHIDENTKDMIGGEIGRDEDGNPNGLLFDNAMDLAYDKLPLPSKEELKRMILLACNSLNSFGITSVQSDDYCLSYQLPYSLINEAYNELIKENKLTIRVYEQANITTVKKLEEFINDGNITGVGNNLFKIGPLKLLGDGSLGSRTAYLSIPYKDDNTTRGFTIFTDQEMNELVLTAHKNNMQIAIHAIGDACLDQVLNAYEKALELYPRDNHRHGIVHYQISRKDQIDKTRKLNLHAYIQTIFLDYDNHIVEDRVGKDLASTSYAWHTLMDKGITISNGSDAPVEVPNVLKGMQCAISRTSIDGTGPYNINEAFSIKEAIDSFTINGAYASFEENIKGLIKQDYLADFVVLDQNPFEVEVNSIHKIKVLKTYLDGRCVYHNDDI